MEATVKSKPYQLVSSAAFLKGQMVWGAIYCTFTVRSCGSRNKFCQLYLELSYSGHHDCKLLWLPKYCPLLELSSDTDVLVDVNQHCTLKKIVGLFGWHWVMLPLPSSSFHPPLCLYVASVTQAVFEHTRTGPMMHIGGIQTYSATVCPGFSPCLHSLDLARITVQLT